MVVRELFFFYFEDVRGLTRTICFALAIVILVPVWGDKPVVVLRDSSPAGTLTVKNIETYLYISTDQLADLGGGKRYFAPKKFKESLRLWGSRVVFSPENPFVVIDGVPYNMGLPTKLDSDGLMVPLAGFFESFALATNSRISIGTDTIRITTAGTSQSGESSAQEEQKPAAKDITGQKSRQKKLIVVDPGHGGKDPGAIGPSGIREKDITLAIAKYLKSELESRGYQVVLTRESDRFITLSDRSKLANQLHADMFISIHCNASKNKNSCGTQGFYLSPAKTSEARATAALENKVLLIEDNPIIDNLDELQFIMADMLQSAYQRESSILAYVIEQNISRRTGLEARGPEGAGFYVLYGTYMPSVLVETAFISNPEEEKFLSKPKNQKKIAEAIADGIDQFFQNINH